MTKRLYQFIALPIGMLLGGDIQILNITSTRGEDAFLIAKASTPERNIQLLGYVDVDKFIEQLKSESSEGPINERVKKVEVKNETDYTKRTEDEITRLIKYLRDAGYKITQPKHKK